MYQLLGVAISDPIYPKRSYTLEDALKPEPKVDGDFWTDLQAKIRIAGLDVDYATEQPNRSLSDKEKELALKKKAIFLEHARGRPINGEENHPYPRQENIVFPKLSSDIQDFLFMILEKFLMNVIASLSKKTSQGDICCLISQVKQRRFLTTLHKHFCCIY